MPYRQEQHRAQLREYAAGARDQGDLQEVAFPAQSPLDPLGINPRKAERTVVVTEVAWIGFGSLHNMTT